MSSSRLRLRHRLVSDLPANHSMVVKSVLTFRCLVLEAAVEAVVVEEADAVAIEEVAVASEAEEDLAVVEVVALVDADVAVASEATVAEAEDLAVVALEEEADLPLAPEVSSCEKGVSQMTSLTNEFFCLPRFN